MVGHDATLRAGPTGYRWRRCTSVLVPPAAVGRVAVVGGHRDSRVVALVGAAPASAHTDLEYTVPADQEQVADPVTQITVAFGDPGHTVGCRLRGVHPAGGHRPAERVHRGRHGVPPPARPATRRWRGGRALRGHRRRRPRARGRLPVHRSRRRAHHHHGSGQRAGARHDLRALRRHHCARGHRSSAGHDTRDTHVDPRRRCCRRPGRRRRRWRFEHRCDHRRGRGPRRWARWPSWCCVHAAPGRRDPRRRPAGRDTARRVPRWVGHPGRRAHPRHRCRHRHRRAAARPRCGGLPRRRPPGVPTRDPRPRARRRSGRRRTPGGRHRRAGGHPGGVRDRLARCAVGRRELARDDAPACGRAGGVRTRRGRRRRRRRRRRARCSGGSRDRRAARGRGGPTARVPGRRGGAPLDGRRRLVVRSRRARARRVVVLVRRSHRHRGPPRRPPRRQRSARHRWRRVVRRHRRAGGGGPAAAPLRPVDRRPRRAVLVGRFARAALLWSSPVRR